MILYSAGPCMLYEARHAQWSNGSKTVGVVNHPLDEMCDWREFMSGTRNSVKVVIEPRGESAVNAL